MFSTDPQRPPPTLEPSDDLGGIVAALVLGFVADPVARWMCGGTAVTHLREFPRILRVLAQDCLNAGAAFRSPGGDGAALWLPPGARTDDVAMQNVAAEAVPADRQRDVADLFAWAHDLSPQESFWYLSLIGVDPAVQGGGVGSALIQDGLRRVDADGLAAYLWSSNPRNIAFYQRHGFAVTGTASFGTSPLITAMLRPARRTPTAD